MSPVFGGLSPVRPGTENLNDDNGLRVFCQFVPGVPGVLRSLPEGNPPGEVPKLAGCVALLAPCWAMHKRNTVACFSICSWPSGGLPRASQARPLGGRGIGAGYGRGVKNFRTAQPETERLNRNLWEAKTAPRGFKEHSEQKASIRCSAARCCVHFNALAWNELSPVFRGDYPKEPRPTRCPCWPVAWPCWFPAGQCTKTFLRPARAPVPGRLVACLGLRRAYRLVDSGRVGKGRG